MKYHFFWKGPFSQWERSKFTVDGVEYNTAEQYMMCEKAKLFGDSETAEKILAATSPKVQKALGRSAKNFDEEKWKAHREDIVYEGNYYKFTQNKRLYDALMATGNKTLVEASPVDVIWGIGLAEDNPDAKDENKWRGLNLLGKTLTRLRDDLRGK